MTLGQLVNRVRKLIELSKDSSTFQGAYFNPAYAERLFDKVKELKTLGFTSSVTETETNDGKVVSGIITAPSGNELDLGSLLLTGKEVVVQNSLETIDDVIAFIQEEGSQEVPTRVNFQVQFLIRIDT